MDFIYLVALVAPDLLFGCYIPCHARVPELLFGCYIPCRARSTRAIVWMLYLVALAVVIDRQLIKPIALRERITALNTATATFDARGIISQETGLN